MMSIFWLFVFEHLLFGYQLILITKQLDDFHPATTEFFHFETYAREAENELRGHM